MPTTLAVGLQQKVGLPDYGSLGASVHLEFEIDRSLLEHDPDGFQKKVSEAFAACRRAVQVQLSNSKTLGIEVVSGPSTANSGPSPHPRSPVTVQFSSHPRDPSATHPPDSHLTGGSASRLSEPVHGSSLRTRSGAITQSQLRAIHAIARRQGIDVTTLVQARFHVDRPESLSLRDASRLIDELKQGTPGVRT